MDKGLVVQIILGLFVLVGSIGGSFLAARASTRAANSADKTENRRIGNDEWQKILDAKTNDIADLRGRLERAEGRIATLERREDAQHEILIVHAAWDYAAAQELRRLGVSTMADPPPLWLPRGMVDASG